MDSIIDGITSWFANIIGDLGEWLGKLDIVDVLKGAASIIPRTIVFFRVLMSPIYSFIGSSFGFITSAIFFSTIGFLIILGLRRGVNK